MRTRWCWARDETTSGGTFDTGFVSFNNVSLNGLGGGAFSGFPLGFGTYPVLISTNLTVGTSWSLTFTVANLGAVIGVEQFDYPDGPIAGKTAAPSGTTKTSPPSAHTGTASNWDNFTGAAPP